MNGVTYVRQGKNRPGVRPRPATAGRGSRATVRARPAVRRPRLRSLSPSPNRLVLTPVNRRQQARDDSVLPSRLKLQVRRSDDRGRGGNQINRRQASPSPEHNGVDSSPNGDYAADKFSKTFFRLVFLGATRVKSSEPSVVELNGLVKEIRDRAGVYKERGVAIPRYTLNINAQKISIMENQTRDVQHIPINMIHYVAADPSYDRVFSMVARGRSNRFLCHVFECNSTEECKTITRSISDAFRLAYEKWVRNEENQSRMEDRRARMDMGGAEYFRNWHDGVLPNISAYNQRPKDELPSLPDRLIVSRSQGGGGGGRRDPEPEPYSLRYSFQDDDEEDDYPQEEVYVRQDHGGRRGRDRDRQQQIVYDIRPDWE